MATKMDHRREAQLCSITPPNLQASILQINVIPAVPPVPSGDHIYEIAPGSYRGLALVINFNNFNGVQATRKGSQTDLKNLSNLWSQLGFKTIIKEDLTLKQLNRKFKVLRFN